MSVVHRWFESGSYSLLGHVHVPEPGRHRLGVLIVPPFGWESVCSYRPLRQLAGMFAENGFPTLRFDLPGTGDSSGGPQDTGLFDAWVASIGDAAEELRAATGVEEVAVLGIHLGATLAVISAVLGSNLHDLILWGPATTGRSLLRELRAFSNMELPEYSTGQPPPPPPFPGLEIAGFLITPETQQALEATDLSTFPSRKGRRVLLLSRDDFPVDSKFFRAVENSGCPVEVKIGTGYAAMMAQPHEVDPPFETGHTIVDFLRRSPMTAGTLLANRPAARNSTKIARSDVVETAYLIERPTGPSFGVLAEPVHDGARSDLCVLLLNAGAIHHIGPNRMWVEAARRWATRGVTSLRLNVPGIGESEGESNLDIPGLYQEQLVEEVEAAMDSLRSGIGFRNFAAIGLCSGAFWAFHAAIRNREVRSAILLNPRLFFWDPEVDCRRTLRRAVKGLTDWTDWRRLARGKVPLRSISRAAEIAIDRLRHLPAQAQPPRQIPATELARAWAAIEKNQSRVAFIFTEGEPLLCEMEEEGQLPPQTNPRIRCHRVANSGHTFRPMWAQVAAHELIDREIDAIVRECPQSVLQQT